jgi:hypothetical protein
MKKTLIMWLFIAASFFVSAQNTLYTVNFVKPKPGMKSTFEAKWKAHLAMYHKATDKRMVYEVLSGPHIGSYHIVEGPLSFADMDKDKPMAKEHGLDLEKNFSPYIEDNSMNGTYRWDDSISSKDVPEAEKFVVNVTHIKNGQLQPTLRELRRGAVVGEKYLKPSSFKANTFWQIWAGSDPVIVNIRALKDGFKELENNYYGPNPNAPTAFKDGYVKEYGQEAWDARSKLMDDNANIVSREVFIMKLRKDLSSQ